MSGASDDGAEAVTTIRLVIAGRVQGVGYRWFAARQAAAHGIVGWVSNLPDGRVAVCARGGRRALADFAHVLEKGPPGSRVDGVERHDDPHDMEIFKSFVVK